jgi:catalase
MIVSKQSQRSESCDFAEPPLDPGETAGRWDHREDTDYHTQPGKLFCLMNPARSMGDIPREIKIRHIGNCLKADPDYGKGVADALGIPLSEVPKG